MKIIDENMINNLFDNKQIIGYLLLKYYHLFIWLFIP